MILPEPARCSRRAHLTGIQRDRSRGGRGAAKLLAAMGACALGGCITVNAPEEPIVIELNINITQEVVYRLAEDVRDNIESNPEIF